MAITRADVDRVAALAHLELEEEEKDRLLGELNRILEHVAKLQELDTGDVPPTSHTLPAMRNVFRDDQPRPCLPRDRALGNAPAADRGFVVVPRVIEG